MKPSHDQVLHAVRVLLAHAGDNPDRPGLAETPERVAKAFSQGWFTGYGEDPAEVLKSFEDGGENYSGILFQANIPVYSHCEHHCAPFFGHAHFGYIPNGKIVGLSKISRLINVFARRLQVQERLTAQVVDAFNNIVHCRGCGIVMELRHMCMESRGIRQRGTITVTSELRGIFLEKPAVQAEFMDLIKMQGQRP